MSVLFFKDRVSHFLAALAQKQRLSGYPVFKGDELTFKVLGHIVNNQPENQQCLNQLYKEMALQIVTHSQKQKLYQYYQQGVLLETDQFEASLRYFNGSDLDKELLLHRCWRMVWADRHLGLREYQIIHLFGYWLGWQRTAIEQLGIIYRPVYISSEHQQALVLLGISLDSSRAFVKQQYKRLLARYHPDKIEGLGGNESDVEKATIMTVKIHEAYTLIAELHGFKSY